MRKLFALVLSAAMIFGAVPIGAAGAARQGQTGTIEGTARDAQQQPLANYTVQLRNVQTGQLVSTGTTSQAGQFTFTSIPPGSYVVEIVNAAGEIIGTTAPIAVAAGTVATVTVMASAAGAMAAAGGAGFGIFGLGTAASAALIGGVAVGTTALIATRGNKITICHKPAGEPAQTLEISESAWDAHLAHGDSRGACPASPAR